MCLTGIVHGSTLSYTRLVTTPEVTRWRNIHSDKLDENDAPLISNGFITVQGMAVDCHVLEWNTKNIVKPVMDVLKKHDNIFKDLITDYKREIEQRDDFREYSWILTDFCNDSYDEKQHVITTSV